MHEGLTGQRTCIGPACVPAHAVCQHGDQLADGTRRGVRRLAANREGVFLVAPRTLAGARRMLKGHHYSLRSDNSDQSNSSPQKGTKASWVRPMVMTSISSSFTAPVGRLSFTATILVLERFGTNRNDRSTES